jgi:hypothetical protein
MPFLDLTLKDHFPFCLYKKERREEEKRRRRRKRRRRKKGERERLCVLAKA